MKRLVLYLVLMIVLVMVSMSAVVKAPHNFAMKSPAPHNFMKHPMPHNFIKDPHNF